MTTTSFWHHAVSNFGVKFGWWFTCKIFVALLHTHVEVLAWCTFRHCIAGSSLKVAIVARIWGVTSDLVTEFSKFIFAHKSANWAIEFVSSQLREQCLLVLGCVGNGKEGHEYWKLHLKIYSINYMILIVLSLISYYQMD